MTQRDKKRIPIEDADLLDFVRKLRSYLSVLDNSHLVIDKLSVADIDDQVRNTSSMLMPQLRLTTGMLADVLKYIENTRQYKSMARKYNLGGNEDV
jgi:hypothetical protein